MTRIFQLIVAVCLVAIASGSCSATPPTGIRTGVAPEFRTPVQVPSKPIATDGVGYLIINVGGNSILFAINGTTVTQLPATVVNLNGPGPAPQPNPPLPTPPLLPRATLFRDAALKATADPSRVATAQKLAFGYLNLVTWPYADADSLKVDVGNVGDSSIPIGAAPAWVPFRIEMAAQWDRLRQIPSSTVADYQALLRDASAGLTASYTP